MRDNLARRTLKRVALGHFVLNLTLIRALRRLRGDRPHRLVGACRGSGCCCERPSIRANLIVWHMPLVRRCFLAWHRYVNGFALVHADREGHTFVFECTHFDRLTRRCDSYDSRPGMCRDYPRVLLDQPAPALFPACGFRAVAPNAEGVLRAAIGKGLTAEQERKLRAGLGLGPDEPA